MTTPRTTRTPTSSSEGGTTKMATTSTTSTTSTTGPAGPAATDKSGIRVKRVSRDEKVAGTPDLGTSESLRPGGLTPSSPAAVPAHPTTPVSDVPDRPRLPRSDVRETKPFWLTSEFLTAAAVMAALLIAGYLRDDSLNTWRTWLLVTVVASAYILSRGIAKAGSPDRR